MGKRYVLRDLRDCLKHGNLDHFDNVGGHTLEGKGARVVFEARWRFRRLRQTTPARALLASLEPLSI